MMHLRIKLWVFHVTIVHSIAYVRRMCGAYGRVRKIAKSDFELRLVCLSVCRSAWNNSAPTGRIYMKFYHFSKIFRETFMFHYNLTRIMVTLHEYRYTVMITSC